jgi:hypothetical protein
MLRAEKTFDEKNYLRIGDLNKGLVWCLDAHVKKVIT